MEFKKVALLLQVLQALHLLHHLTAELFFAAELRDESARAPLLMHVRFALNVITCVECVFLAHGFGGRVVGGHSSLLQRV